MIYLFIVGRILLGGFFLKSGYSHMKNLKMMAGYAGSKGMPIPSVAVFVTGLMLLLGGVSIILGFQTFIGMILLIAFLAPAALIFHAFWKETDPNAKMASNMLFWRNVALIGALLMLIQIPLPWAAALF